MGLSMNGVNLTGRTSMSAVTGNDPYFSDVTLLLHCDGADESTSFVDSSLLNQTITVSGGAEIDTTVVKYGTGSLKATGASSYITATGGGTMFNPGVGSWTLEGWAQNSTGLNAALLSGNTNDFYLIQSGNAWIVGDGINNNMVVGYNQSAATWFFWTLVRNAGVFTLFFDGVVALGGVSSPALKNVNITSLIISGHPPTNSYNLGYMDDIRITNGVARYTANFTPPAAAFPNS